MATQTKIIVNEDGVHRPATEIELENIASIQESATADEAARLTRAAKKQEVLAKLGLTAEEAAVLLA